MIGYVISYLLYCAILCLTQKRGGVDRPPRPPYSDRPEMVIRDVESLWRETLPAHNVQYRRTQLNSTRYRIRAEFRVLPTTHENCSTDMLHLVYLPWVLESLTLPGQCNPSRTFASQMIKPIAATYPLSLNFRAKSCAHYTQRIFCCFIPTTCARSMRRKQRMVQGEKRR